MEYSPKLIQIASGSQCSKFRCESHSETNQPRKQITTCITRNTSKNSPARNVRNAHILQSIDSTMGSIWNWYPQISQCVKDKARSFARHWSRHPRWIGDAQWHGQINWLSFRLLLLRLQHPRLFSTPWSTSKQIRHTGSSSSCFTSPIMVWSNL